MARYSASQVYTYVGYVESYPLVDGLDAQEAQTFARGFAVANGHVAVIEALREAGFVVTALSSLADVQSTVSVMEVLRRRDPEALSEDDLLITDTMRDQQGAYAASQVFTFAGHAGQVGPISAGFMIAASEADLLAYLSSFGFSVNAVSSLADLENLAGSLQEAAEGRLDSTVCLDLIEDAAEAA